MGRNFSNESRVSDDREMRDFQRESVRLFAHAARAFNLPRSVGQIYGLLFSARDPLNLDEVVAALKISKGSASQGLKWLRELHAVKVAFEPGDRRDRYVAETELRRLATGFLRNTAEPHLSNGNEYLNCLEEASRAIKSDSERAFSVSRLRKLQRWHHFAHRVLPVILKMTEKF